MSKRLLIKVCGMREPQNIEAVARMDIDIIGLIFVPESPRFVPQVSSLAGMIPDLPAFRTDGLRKRVSLAGVFSDTMPQSIVTAVYNYHLDLVQLHGHESPVMIDNLRRTLVPDIVPRIKIMKTINVGEPADLELCRQYEGLVDCFLFDTKSRLGGGSGRKFNWQALSGYSAPVPFFLSGGIGPDDVEAVKSFSHPMLAGIDVNSAFEAKPGLKDAELLRTFVESIRK